VQDWMLLRLPRTARAMREAAARLDRLALARGGPVTRALAAEALAGMVDNGDRSGADAAPASPDVSLDGSLDGSLSGALLL
jgi:hypothetical protein